MHHAMERIKHDTNMQDPVKVDKGRRRGCVFASTGARSMKKKNFLQSYAVDRSGACSFCISIGVACRIVEGDSLVHVCSGCIIALFSGK